MTHGMEKKCTGAESQRDQIAAAFARHLRSPLGVVKASRSISASSDLIISLLRQGCSWVEIAEVFRSAQLSLGLKQISVTSFERLARRAVGTQRHVRSTSLPVAVTLDMPSAHEVCHTAQDVLPPDPVSDRSIQRVRERLSLQERAISVHAAAVRGKNG